MQIFEVIRAKKEKLKIHDWNDGKIPYSIFPLNRNGKFQAGSEWSWRLVEFDALGNHFRILTRLNTAKSIYSSILAMDSPRGLLVISHHELHKSHRNWHCHLVRGDISAIFPGVLRDRDLMSIYPSQSGDCNVRFAIDKRNAMTITAGRYRFVVQGELV